MVQKRNLETIILDLEKSVEEKDGSIKASAAQMADLQKRIHELEATVAGQQREIAKMVG